MTRNAACRSALVVKGEHVFCDLDAPHHPLAHSSRHLEAIWGDDESPRTPRDALQEAYR